MKGNKGREGRARTSEPRINADDADDARARLTGTRRASIATAGATRAETIEQHRTQRIGLSAVSFPRWGGLRVHPCQSVVNLLLNQSTVIRVNPRPSAVPLLLRSPAEQPTTDCTDERGYGAD